MNRSRAAIFASSIRRLAEEDHSGNLTLVVPTAASEEQLRLFHTPEYVDFVRMSSETGAGFLDYGDTPSFKGVYEASLFPVGSTLNGIELIMKKRFDHFFNPIGGLHHARKDKAGGFCVFNDAAIAVCRLLELGMERVAYVDIDAHHGDGVFYAFESDPRVGIGDLHEDGRFLYPGTGSASEVGKGKAAGTKLNVPMAPGAGDTEFKKAFAKVEDLVSNFEPEFVLFQCGADSLLGDPIAQLAYTRAAHAHAARKLHEIAHRFSQGRILAMGGGGYDPRNVSDAWIAVAEELAGIPNHAGPGN